MTYQETVDFLFSQLPMYQRKGKAAYKADLSNTISLCNSLDNPENKFKSIHVAGTNGKGSTSHFIASILQEAGYKVGLYTSPHLLDFRERIRINGEMILEQYVIDFVRDKSAVLDEISPSFFEWTIGLAFQYFADEEVDVAVIEVGLGGRLDSTNVITPMVSVITNIGLDHTQFLGDTLPKVAAEKAGIIKQNVPVVIGETQSEIQDVFINKAKELGAPILFADQLPDLVSSMDLVSYQQKNVRTATRAIAQLNARDFSVNKEQFQAGINHMVQNTGLRGRWEVLQQKPLVIVDTAHNKEGLIYTMAELKKLTTKTKRIVFGMVNDKDASAVLELLPADAVYYLCQPSIERAMLVDDLEKLFVKKNLNYKIFDTVNAAKTTAITDSQQDDVVYIGGSTFVVADAL